MKDPILENAYSYCFTLLYIFPISCIFSYKATLSSLSLRHFGEPCMFEPVVVPETFF